MKVALRPKVVQRIMAAKNLRQNALARLIGTSSGYMSQLMNLKRWPSPEFRETMLEKLNANQRLRNQSEYKFEDLFEIVE